MSNDTIPEMPDVTDRDVFITRAFDAPREVVWNFFTRPELLALWFGPKEVHVDPASVVIELKVGGRWDLDMVDNATGARYPMASTLVIVTPPEYLECAETPVEGSGPQNDLRLRIWFHDHGSKTRLTIHQGPFTSEFRDMTLAGWESSFVKIDELLASGVS
ncbi:MAG: SRPBCC domain-containing protein [Pseudolysinimonas sp.]